MHDSVVGFGGGWWWLDNMHSQILSLAMNLCFGGGCTNSAMYDRISDQIRNRMPNSVWGIQTHCWISGVVTLRAHTYARTHAHTHTHTHIHTHTHTHTYKHLHTVAHTHTHRHTHTHCHPMCPAPSIDKSGTPAHTHIHTHTEHDAVYWQHTQEHGNAIPTNRWTLLQELTHVKNSMLDPNVILSSNLPPNSPCKAHWQDVGAVMNLSVMTHTILKSHQQ